MKLVGAKFKANRRKSFVMPQAVDLPRRSFPKHAGIARSLHAVSGIWRCPYHMENTSGSGNPLSRK